MVEVEESAMREEAARIVEALPKNAVVWLQGEIGAGKTTIARHMSAVVGADSVTSPTFALVHEYDTGEGPIIHVDCYRLTDVDEALDLDFPDLQRRARLLIVEWPERAGEYAPRPDLVIRMGHTGDPMRRAIEMDRR